MKKMKETSIKKSVWGFCMAIAMCLLLLSGCGQDGADYSDAKFIRSVSDGLDARWQITNVEFKDEDITVQGLTDAIQAELDQLTAYESAEFEDSKLQEKAIKYIKRLKDSKGNVNYAFSDDYEENEKWEELYDERTMLIKDFVDNYGLTVSSKWQDTLDELLAAGKTAEANKNTDDAMEALAKGLEFEEVENDDGWKTYEAILENTTDYDIGELYVTVSLLDEDGVIIYTEDAYAENVNKGQKAKMEFDTDEDFDKYEVALESYEVK